MIKDLEISESFLSGEDKEKFEAELAMISEIARDLKATRVNTPIQHTANIHQQLSGIADQYEIRYLGKKEIKKLPLRHMEALINYGRAYIKDFENGRFLFNGDQADFDEAEAYTDIVNVVNALEREIRQRT